MPLTPEERSHRARIAALARWSKERPTLIASQGQAGLLAKFEREVDPDGLLDPTERRRRAECARKLHMQRMAWKSRKVRAARKAAREGGAA